MPGLEQITWELDNKSVLKAIAEINQATSGTENKFGSAGEHINASLQKISDYIGRVSDKQVQANDRIVASIERRAAAEGKNPVERLVAERDKLIKKLGDEEKQIDRVRVAYDKLIKAEQSKGGGGNFGETIKKFVESPFSAAGGAASGFLETLGPVGIGLAGVATGAVAVGGALFEIVKTSGEAAEGLTNLSASSGISIGNLDRLQAMAKLTGLDISTLARAGTSMAQTLDQGGEKAKTLISTLGKLHVSTVDLNGAQKDEGQILTETITALGSVTDNTQRLALAAEALGPRVSKSLSNLLKQYGDLDKAARELGFGNRDELLKSLTDSAEELHKLGLMFDQVKDHVAGFVLTTIGGFKTILDGLKPVKDEITAAFSPLLLAIGYIEKYNDAVREKNKLEELGPDSIQRHFTEVNRTSASRFNQGLTGTKEALEDKIKTLTDERDKAQRIIDSASRGEVADTGKLREAETTVTRNNAAIEANKNLVELISKRKSLLQELHTQEATAGNAELDSIDKINAKWDENIRKLKEVGVSGKQLATETALINKARQAEIDQENRKLDQQESRQLRQIQVNENRAKLRQQQAGVTATPIRELGTFGVSASDIEASIQGQYAKRVQEAQQEHDFEITLANELKLENGKTDERAKQVAIAKADSQLRISTGDADLQRQKELTDLHQKDIDQQKKFFQDYGKLAFGSQADVIRSGAQFNTRIAGLNNKDNPGQAIEDTFKIQITEAQEVYALEVKRIQTEEDGYTAALSFEKARRQLVKETTDAQNEAILKQIELQHQQFDGLKKDLEGLYNTLFTKPKDFGKQFSATIHTAALRPITEGLSGLTAGVLQPLIYGSDGKGGLAGATRGLFGSTQTQSPIKLSTDANTQSTDANTQAVYTLTALLSATTGQPNPPTPTGTHTAIALPSFSRSTISSVPALSNAFSALSLGLGAPLSTASSGSVFAGTPSASAVSSSIDFGNGAVPLGSSISTSGFGGGSAFATPGFFPPSSVTGGGSSGFNFAPALSAILGGGGSRGASPGVGLPSASRGFGFKLPNFSGLAQTFGIGAATKNTQDVGLYGDTVSDSGTSFGSVLSSPGAGALFTSVGLPLTTAGLFGNNRGTGTGIAESTIGGALTGAGIGTEILPGLGTAIGAGIGAGVGALASGIEALTGDISPQQKAKKYAKQFYGITISNQVANSIAQIAQSKYAGNVQVAVRSPEVRQMLGLYAAGTGQSNSKALSSLTPHGSALAEQGGTLFQQATYQYGQAYTYKSPLPTLGGISSQQYPTAGSPINLSLNIGNQSTADFLNGSVVTPENINNQLQAANASSMNTTQNQALYQQTPGLISS
jgi:hypothetical protein